MNKPFERTGPLAELASYPPWAQDLVDACEPARHAVVRHPIWQQLREARLSRAVTRHFMVGVWPVIERFPAYMGLNLLKTSYGRSAGDDLARRWLVRNIRVEQNHAEHWLRWAEGAGVARADVLAGLRPVGSQALAEWCEEVSRHDTLAAGIVATNYAVEGATGEWSRRVYESAAHAASLPAATRARSLRWLQLHAACDDAHPWEALEIVCTLKGMAPAADDVAHLTECVKRTYVCMRVTLDRCMDGYHGIRDAGEVAA